MILEQKFLVLVSVLDTIEDKGSIKVIVKIPFLHNTLPSSFNPGCPSNFSMSSHKCINCLTYQMIYT